MIMHTFPKFKCKLKANFATRHTFEMKITFVSERYVLLLLSLRALIVFVLVPNGVLLDNVKQSVSSMRLKLTISRIALFVLCGPSLWPAHTVKRIFDEFAFSANC